MEKLVGAYSSSEEGSEDNHVSATPEQKPQGTKKFQLPSIQEALDLVPETFVEERADSGSDVENMKLG